MKKLSIALGSIVALTLSALSICAQTPSREDLIKEIGAKRAELLKLEEAFLSPSPEDRAQVADFLSQPDTGLIRLLPREKYDPDVRNQNKYKITIQGGGG